MGSSTKKVGCVSFQSYSNSSPPETKNQTNTQPNPQKRVQKSQLWRNSSALVEDCQIGSKRSSKNSRAMAPNLPVGNLLSTTISSVGKLKTLNPQIRKIPAKNNCFIVWVEWYCWSAQKKRQCHKCAFWVCKTIYLEILNRFELHDAWPCLLLSYFRQASQHIQPQLLQHWLWHPHKSTSENLWGYVLSRYMLSICHKKLLVNPDSVASKIPKTISFLCLAIKGHLAAKEPWGSLWKEAFPNLLRLFPDS